VIVNMVKYSICACNASTDRRIAPISERNSVKCSPDIRRRSGTAVSPALRRFANARILPTGMFVVRKRSRSFRQPQQCGSHDQAPLRAAPEKPDCGPGFSVFFSYNAARTGRLADFPSDNQNVFPEKTEKKWHEIFKHAAAPRGTFPCRIPAPRAGPP
jgi:hypothetical protein